MAISKNLKVFDYQGKRYQFDAKSFDDISKQHKDKKRIKLRDIESIIANAVHVSDEAVRNWRYGKNGPSELSMIEKIREVLELKELTSLLIEYDGGENMVALADREKTALKKVYDSIIDFLYEFIDTDGFEIVMYDIEHGIKCDFSEKMYDEINDKVKNVYRTLNKEYFDLGRHEVYNELNEYINNYVYDMFDGKFAYRDGKTVVIQSGLTSEEEYANALSALNRIVEKYV